MSSLLALTRTIDKFLGVIARIGAICGLFLVILVVFDVVTRKMGMNKEALFGVNSTQFQEFEYWLHTFLFTLVIGYAYTKQAHVRIDLVRDRLPLKAKYFLEVIGCIFFLLPFAILMVYYNSRYVMASFYEGEASASVIGMKHIWIHKAFLPTMFVLLVLAGISQLIKSLAGLTGHLPDDMVRETLGGDN